MVVARAPAAVPSVSLTLAPANVLTGQTATLTWSATNASACVASGAWAGNHDTSGSTTVSQAVAGTYTYALDCTGAGGSASGSVTLGTTALARNMAPVFIDSGSNGLFFSDASIPRCSAFTGYNGFYCPAATLSLSAVNASADGTASGSVSFKVENPLALDLAVKAASVGGSFGSTRRPTAFDWGMPFFFERTV